MSKQLVFLKVEAIGDAPEVWVNIDQIIFVGGHDGTTVIQCSDGVFVRTKEQPDALLGRLTFAANRQ